jgi:CRISPR-associated protein Csm2
MFEEMLDLRDLKRDYLDKHLRLAAEGKDVKPELYSDIPEQVAYRIACHKSTNRRTGQEEIGPKKENKPSQLRRFYDELSLWNERVSTKPADFGMYLPLVKMLKAKVAYAKGRGHVDADFETLMRHCIDQVHSPATLTQCKTFFEAFMGFYKAARPKD